MDNYLGKIWALIVSDTEGEARRIVLSEAALAIIRTNEEEAIVATRVRQNEGRLVIDIFYKSGSVVSVIR